MCVASSPTRKSCIISTHNNIIFSIDSDLTCRTPLHVFICYPANSVINNLSGMLEISDNRLLLIYWNSNTDSPLHYILSSILLIIVTISMFIFLIAQLPIPTCISDHELHSRITFWKDRFQTYFPKGLNNKNNTYHLTHNLVCLYPWLMLAPLFSCFCFDKIVLFHYACISRIELVHLCIIKLFYLIICMFHI